VILPTLTLKVAVALPAGTITLAGTTIACDVELTARLVFESTDCESTTVHKLVPPDITPLGSQASDVTKTGALKLIAIDCPLPLYKAVSDPLWSDVKEPACRVN